MTRRRTFALVACVFLVPSLVSCISRRGEKEYEPAPIPVAHFDHAPADVVGDRATASQTPTWTSADREAFLNGSLSNEVFPERILAAFEGAYPELYPGGDLSSFGVVPGGANGLPVGFSRAEVDHLGGLSSLGLNCSACHTAQITPAGGGAAVLVLGAPNRFNTEAFIGAFVAAMAKTAADPMAMRHFLYHYLEACDPQAGLAGEKLVQAQWGRQADALKAAMADDPTATKGLTPGTLHEIAPADLRIDGAMVQGTFDLLPIVKGMLKVFQNIRTVIHFPAEPPAAAPPPSGPGRFNAFGLVSQSLYGVPTIHAPVKYGVLFDLERRPWVHWDGNTGSPIVRNLIAALGLGAPLLGKHAKLDIAKVTRQTQLSQGIRPPTWPWEIDRAAAARGKGTYEKSCASCHDGAENDGRLHAPAEVGTDDARARLFDENQAKLTNEFMASLQIDGWTPPAQPTVRSTGKYWAADLGGVWARAPYLHNGSVPTLWDLLTPPANRPKTWHRGTSDYDAVKVGYADGGAYLFDTAGAANGNGGHAYGTDLADAEKKDLIEYLKTK